MNKVDLKKGTGTVLFGTGLMMIVLIITFVLMQTFMFRINASDTQTVADSVADGTAVYMANEGSSYDEALDKAEEIQQLIEDETGVATENLIIDEDAFENNQIMASLSITDNYLVSEYNGSSTYTFNRSATTEFIGSGIRGFASTLSWLVDSIPYAIYSKGIRTGQTVDGYISSADCSSMCWMVYRKMGCTAPLWYTDSMADTYFYEISES